MAKPIITVESDTPRFRGSVTDRVVTLAIADMDADLPSLLASFNETAVRARTARLAAEKAAAEKAAAEKAAAEKAAAAAAAAGQ